MGSSLKIDADTARYAISTFVQSEAAILALVFSLSLVAMQQTASSYPPDVSKLFYDFTKNPIYHYTLLIYLLSVILVVCVLIQIPHVPENKLVEIDEASIRFTFQVSIFTFLSILPFVFNTFNFLVPHKLINILQKNRKSGISAVEDKDCIRVLGILLNSLKKHDYDAVKKGLDYFEEYNKEFTDFQQKIVVPLENDRHLKLEKSLYCLAHYFVEVGELSLKLGSTDCNIKIIKNLYDIRIAADEHEIECVTSLTTKSIGKLAKKVIYPLISELNDENSQIHECAVFALGEVRDERVIESIITLTPTNQGISIEY